MNRAAVDSPLENKHGSTLRIFGIFLDHDRRAGASEELIHRESIVSESVVAVLRYPNVSSGDEGGELLPKAGHRALSQGDRTIAYVPTRTWSMYSSFQPAESRLFFTPSFAVFSFSSSNRSRGG
jgi:hypothetical protein